jgi:antitoxin component of MazEF toxin-antitoxin module
MEIRRITVVGKRSLAIVIPAEIVKNLKLKKGQALKIATGNNFIIITKI